MWGITLGVTTLWLTAVSLLYHPRTTYIPVEFFHSPLCPTVSVQCRYIHILDKLMEYS